MQQQLCTRQRGLSKPWEADGSMARWSGAARPSSAVPSLWEPCGALWWRPWHMFVRSRAVSLNPNINNWHWKERVVDACAFFGNGVKHDKNMIKPDKTISFWGGVCWTSFGDGISAVVLWSSGSQPLKNKQIFAATYGFAKRAVQDHTIFIMVFNLTFTVNVRICIPLCYMHWCAYYISPSRGLLLKSQTFCGFLKQQVTVTAMHHGLMFQHGASSMHRCLAGELPVPMVHPYRYEWQEHFGWHQLTVYSTQWAWKLSVVEGPHAWLIMSQFSTIAVFFSVEIIAGVVTGLDDVDKTYLSDGDGLGAATCNFNHWNVSSTVDIHSWKLLRIPVNSLQAKIVTYK